MVAPVTEGKVGIAGLTGEADVAHVNLCWVCSNCGRDNRASLDPFEDEEEINWASDAELWGKCEACGTEHELLLQVTVRAIHKP